LNKENVAGIDIDAKLFLSIKVYQPIKKSASNMTKLPIEAHE
jgi:hypothetical protein